MTKDLGVRCQVSGVRTDGRFSVQVSGQMGVSVLSPAAGPKSSQINQKRSFALG
jgi:hypothetical protein